MAINKNHEFEELNGVKCGIAERNAKPERVAFLKELLEQNSYTVVIAPSAPPKLVQPVVPKEGEVALPIPPQTEQTFSVGVTDYTFNPINAIFGRMLKTKNGHIVTLAYWYQKETTSHDEIPYYENGITGD